MNWITFAFNKKREKLEKKKLRNNNNKNKMKNSIWRSAVCVHIFKKESVHSSRTELNWNEKYRENKCLSNTVMTRILTFDFLYYLSIIISYPIPILFLLLLWNFIPFHAISFSAAYTAPSSSLYVVLLVHTARYIIAKCMGIANRICLSIWLLFSAPLQSPHYKFTRNARSTQQKQNVRNGETKGNDGELLHWSFGPSATTPSTTCLIGHSQGWRTTTTHHQVLGSDCM